jgi:hypothetical protein
MKKQFLKSVWAVLAGFILVAGASITTDIILTKTGLMKQPFHLNTTSFIAFVVFYRCLYGTTGSYLTAKLAPGNPIKHAIIGGIIGLLIATIGTIAMWDKSPHWYPIALIITALPCAWLGAKLFIKRNAI